MDHEQPRPRRRNVATAAAWAVPVLAVGAAAPAQAASNPCAAAIPPYPASGTENEHWLVDGFVGDNFGNFVGGTSQFVDGSWVTDAQVRSNLAAICGAYFKDGLPVVGGQTYTFTYSYSIERQGNRPVEAYLLIDGSPLLSSYISSTSTTSGVVAATWVAPSTGSPRLDVTLRYPAGPGVATPKITLSSITLTCS